MSLASAEMAGYVASPENVAWVRSRTTYVGPRALVTWRDRITPPTRASTPTTATTGRSHFGRPREGAAPTADGRDAAASAEEKSPADLKRSAGTLASAFATALSIPSGIVSRTVRTRVGRSVSSL